MSPARPRRHRRGRIAISAALSAVTILATACSSSGGGSTNNANGQSGGASGGSCPTANSKLKLGFVYADTTQNPFQEMALGAEWAAKEDGNVDLKTSAPTPLNNPQEVTMLQAMGRQATDGIAYETVAPELFGRALKEITDAGTPVIAVDAAPPPNSGVNTFVGNSNTELGKLLGQAFVAQNPNPTGTVVLGNDIPSLQLLVQRLDGVQEVLKEKLPNLKIVGPLNSGSTNTDNYNLWKSIVNSHSSAEAFIGVGAADGFNLPLIEKQSGRNFMIGSADLPPQALTAVQDGKVFALSSPEHWMKGYIAMHLLIQAKRTCTPIPTGWWDSGNLLVDKSNIDAIIARQKSPEARAAFFKDEIAKQLANPPIKPMSAAD
jgi:ribose transport system substrate-binding protein